MIDERPAFFPGCGHVVHNPRDSSSSGKGDYKLVRRARETATPESAHTATGHNRGSTNANTTVCTASLQKHIGGYADNVLTLLFDQPDSKAIVREAHVHALDKRDWTFKVFHARASLHYPLSRVPFLGG